MYKKDIKYDDFPLKAYDKVRFRDTDQQGHVNNAVFSTYFETGRTEFIYLKERLHDEDATFVIANIDLNYLREIKWPGTVEIGSQVTKIGRSSIALFQALYQNNRLVATAETVIVHMSQKTRQSQALSEASKLILEKYKK